jgi:hypothetical protein
MNGSVLVDIAMSPVDITTSIFAGNGSSRLLLLRCHYEADFPQPIQFIACTCSEIVIIALHGLTGRAFYVPYEIHLQKKMLSFFTVMLKGSLFQRNFVLTTKV